MSTEYTPTTEEVRDAWAKRNALYRSTSLMPQTGKPHVAVNDARYGAEDYAEFGRWLETHDAEVAAKALERAASFVEDHFDVDGTLCIHVGERAWDNPLPYEWLRAEAARLREGREQ